MSQSKISEVISGKAPKQLRQLPQANFSAVSGKSNKRRKLEVDLKLNENNRCQSGEPESADVEKECLILTSLNDDVLLHVSTYLNWIDTINLAATCERLLQLNYLCSDKKCKEFIFDGDMETMLKKLPTKVLDKITPQIKVITMNKHSGKIMSLCNNVESLRINYEISDSAACQIDSFMEKSNIKHFSLKTSGDNDFGKIQKFENFRHLTEFSLNFNDTIEDAQLIYSLLKNLGEKSQVHKLELLDIIIGDGIFEALKSFNYLSALTLCCYVPMQDFANFVLANPSPRLKHLKVSTCFSNELFIIIKEWTSLETFCFYLEHEGEHRKIRGNYFLMQILNLSRNRSKLTLHIMAERDSELPVHTEIYFDFVNQRVNKKEHNDEFCCSATKIFKFPSKECFSYEPEIYLDV